MSSWLTCTRRGALAWRKLRRSRYRRLRWGELQAHAERRGRPRPVNDTWIATSCLVRGLPLATLNVKDFSDIGPPGAPFNAQTSPAQWP